VLNLLTEDNLPSYHREAAQAFAVGGTGREVWGEWLDTWTAEESRHSLALRDYLHSRSGSSGDFDLDDYERRRMRMLRAGWHPVDKTPLRFLAFVAVQELATRISHRNTGQRGGEQCLDRLLAQIAFDENLHMLLYRNLVGVAIDIDPAAMLAALVAELASFEMPGAKEPQFRAVARRMASAGIYNLRIHASDVVAPLLRYWRVFERRLPNEAEPYRELLATGLAQLDLAAVRQSERIAQAGPADGRTTLLSRTT
jgi:acyl-[acyl-carrier-protein] desaturase